MIARTKRLAQESSLIMDQNPLKKANKTMHLLCPLEPQQILTINSSTVVLNPSQIHFAALFTTGLKTYQLRSAFSRVSEF